MRCGTCSTGPPSPRVWPSMPKPGWANGSGSRRCEMLWRRHMWTEAGAGNTCMRSPAHDSALPSAAGHPRHRDGHTGAGVHRDDFSGYPPKGAELRTSLSGCEPSVVYPEDSLAYGLPKVCPPDPIVVPAGTVTGTVVPGGPEMVTVLPCTQAVTTPSRRAVAHSCWLCRTSPFPDVGRLTIGALGP